MMVRNKKIKSSKNLNKWRKGDSCASNPRIDKHRKLALENRTGLVKLKNRGLTVDAVKAHTFGTDVGEANTLRADDVASEDFRSNHSNKTFATNFTTCTIPAFEKFFEKYTKTSALHNRMLSIHSVVQEEIQNTKLSETSTSYLCGLMKCLTAVKNDEEDLDATLKLLSMVIKHANPAVLQQCFGLYISIFDDVFNTNAESRHALVNLFGCLSVLLRAQQPTEWSYPYIRNVIKKMLDYTVCDIPKTRHSAQYNIAAIMKGSCFMPDYASEEVMNTDYVEHPISKFVGEFVYDELVKSTTLKNARSTLHLLIFLKLCISSLPASALELICTKLLQIIHMGDSLVKKCSMEVIMALFKAEVTSLTSDQMSCMVRALTISSNKSQGLQLVPNINDSSLCGVWMTVVSHGIIRLFKLDPEVGFKILSSWFDQLVYCWNSEHVSIHDEVEENILLLLTECIEPLEEEMHTRESELRNILSIINKGLSLQCQNAWSCVFRTIASAIQVIGQYLPQAVTESVKSVSEFACEQHSFYWKSVESTIGKAIESIGVQAVMTMLPIQITGNFAVDGKNLWILPIVKKHVKNGSLRFFQSYFAFLAEKCHLIVETLKQKGEKCNLLYKQYETVEMQFWGLFPPFAKHASDQEEFLKDFEFCKKLCIAIKNRDDIRKDILLGLRNMIENCNREKPGIMAIYAKNYIPALFNLFLTKPKALVAEGEQGIDNSHRLVAFNTANLFFTITPKNEMDMFFEAVMKKLDDDENDFFRKKALFGLLKELVPYLSSENIQKIYEFISKHLPLGTTKVEDSVMQKAAYRIIEKILQTKTEPCSNFTSSKFWEIAGMMKRLPRRNAFSSRLNILHLLLDNMSMKSNGSKEMKLLRFCVRASVANSKRKNCKGPRLAAYRLLFSVGPAMEKAFQLSTEDMLGNLLSCFHTSKIDSVIGSQIDMIIVILMKYKEFIDFKVMAKAMLSVLNNLTMKSTVISGACLSFLAQVFRFWPVSFMSDFVEMTVVHLSNMDVRCRQVKHRMLVRKLICRLLRKFGGERIKAAIPKSSPVMRKILKNLMTLEMQKKKEKVQKEMLVDEDEYEDEVTPASGLAEILKELDLDDDDEGGRKKKPKSILRKKIYIKEGGENEVTDLLDPSSVFTMARKVKFAPERTTRKPAEADFKIDEKTGKFIIEEETGKSKGKKDDDHYMNMIAQDTLFKSSTKRGLSYTEDDSDQDDFNPTPKKVRKTTQIRSNKKGKIIGAEFKAKKAGGDVKKKGGLLPYAYVKLDRKMINRRFQSKYTGQFKGIVSKGIRQTPRKIRQK